MSVGRKLSHKINKLGHLSHVLWEKRRIFLYLTISLMFFTYVCYVVRLRRMLISNLGSLLFDQWQYFKS